MGRFAGLYRGLGSAFAVARMTLATRIRVSVFTGQVSISSDRPRASHVRIVGLQTHTGRRHES